LANLFVATGHFRSGLMLSAGTGAVMAQLLAGAQPELPLDSFQP
jgi:glycine/D-amino acid oxidase-like deaminating enzyme